jgi:tRNA (guanine-N(7)-)-methyltransferase subunit TRM82
VLPSDPTTLISGGGDPFLHVWDWYSGTLKATIPVLDVVRPHLLVKGERERRKALARAIAKPKGKGGKRKEESDEGSMALDGEGNGDVMVEDIPTPGNTTQAMPDLPPEEEVFVVSKMASCSMSDGNNVLVFSALGCLSLLLLLQVNILMLTLLPGELLFTISRATLSMKPL